MDQKYSLETIAEIELDGTPIALKTLSFSSPAPVIAAVINEARSVLLFQPGAQRVASVIRTGEDPVDITGGGGDLAYVCCRGSQIVDILNKTSRVGQIMLPGRPHGIAWNGSFHPQHRRILVTCQLPNSDDGVVCVIDERDHRVTNVVPVGKQPRSISLVQQKRILLVSNFGGDSVTVIDPMGTKVLHTLATAGRPWAANDSWADPEHIIISLQAGGVLQRMDAMHFPPALSGLTVLRRAPDSQIGFTPACCVPIGQDDLWVAPDKSSEIVALVRCRGREFQQIDSFALGPADSDTTGLGQIAMASLGLPSKLYVANLKRKQLMLTRFSRRKAA